MANDYNISDQCCESSSPTPVSGTVEITNDVGNAIPTADAADKVEDAAHASGAIGDFVLGVRNDGATTSLTDTTGDYSPIAVNAQGAVWVARQPAATATLANVNDSASSATLQASNTARRGWSCFNDSISDLYIKFGATASVTSFTTKVAAGGYYEMPVPIYTGIIDGIWSADSTGAARVTELT